VSPLHEAFSTTWLSTVVVHRGDDWENRTGDGHRDLQLSGFRF
jgi:hypothetical protein